MHNTKLYKLLFLLSLFTNLSCATKIKKNKRRIKPKLTVVFIIDQFAHHYLPKLNPHFKYAFKTLLYKGVVYHNAYHPHGTPTTATGHATISTGTVARDHGIVLNNWYDAQGETVKLDSPHELLVDTLSDQCVFSNKYSVYALSLKQRAAIALAGKLGKAIWFDASAHKFVSSQDYFSQVPEWLTNFNKKQNMQKITQLKWNLFYPQTDKAYKFKYITDYTHAGNEPIAGKLLTFSSKDTQDEDDDEEKWERTPYANNTLLKLSKTCLDFHLTHKKNKDLVLWISLSSLDKVGHLYGPDSLEVIDMLYHLDKQLLDFMSYSQKKVGKNNVLFVLTGDHGVAPIPEILQKQGYSTAYRIYTKKLIPKMNALIKDLYGVENIVKTFKTNQFYLNRKLAQTLDAYTKQGILTTLRDFLLDQPGIKHCWLIKELAQAAEPSGYLERYYKNQFNESRVGDLICCPYPYCLIIKYPNGTAHRSMYAYDTHVPLILYQDGMRQKKTVEQKVYITQLAVSLANILEVSHPSASPYAPLPGIK